ncbi:MAG: hypothetical protein KIT16_19305 [Rhodospirillaceae bacterium]|nr:hypothetical protein [Rhodospirillaceae bacterium]
MFRPKTPRYTIPTRQIGAVAYPDKKAVGIQFVDPEGGHIFVTIPGALVPQLADALKKAVEKNPEALKWEPAPYSFKG